MLFMKNQQPVLPAAEEPDYRAAPQTAWLILGTPKQQFFLTYEFTHEFISILWVVLGDYN